MYEDDNFLGFLDINPRSPGHVQVIPKKHYRWVWDVPDVGGYFEIVRKIARAQQKAFGTEAIWSRITGEEIAHAHVWIFPDPKQVKGGEKNFEENAEKIKSFL